MSVRRLEFYDRGRILEPIEKLRMRNLGFSEAEARLLTTAVERVRIDDQQAASKVVGEQVFSLQGGPGWGRASGSLRLVFRATIPGRYAVLARSLE